MNGLTHFRVGPPPACDLKRPGTRSLRAALSFRCGFAFAICVQISALLTRVGSHFSVRAVASTSAGVLPNCPASIDKPTRVFPIAELEGLSHAREFGEERDFGSGFVPYLPVISRALLRLTAKQQPGRALQHGGLLLPLRGRERFRLPRHPPDQRSRSASRLGGPPEKADLGFRSGLARSFVPRETSEQKRRT